MPTPFFSEEEIRNALDHWSQGGFFRAPRLGSRSELVRVVPCAAHTFTLRTQYEKRQVERALTPYRSGPVDDSGTPPDPWDIPVPKPNDFEDRTVSIPVPHTERVENCPVCHGLGFNDCTSCRGDGRVNCSSCGGTGRRTQVMMRPQPMFNGRFMTTIMVPYTIMVPCGCGTGLVPCSGCGGSGRRDCATCATCGTVKVFRKLTVTFQAPEQSEAQQPEGLTAADLQGDNGQVVIDEQSPWPDGCPALPLSVRQHVEAMIAESQKVDPGEVRVLFQRLTVVRMPVLEVQYRYWGRRERRLWVAGDGMRVIAPNAPRAWGRILATVIAVVLAVLGAVGILFAASAWDGTIRLTGALSAILLRPCADSNLSSETIP